MAFYEVSKERILNLREGGGHDPPKKTPLAPRHSYGAQYYKMVFFAKLKVKHYFMPFLGNLISFRSPPNLHIFKNVANMEQGKPES